MSRLIFLILFLISTAAFAADKTLTLQVKGLSCPICAGAVEKQMKKISGVKSVKIHLSKGQATIIADESVPNESLLSAVEEAGFTAGDIEKVEVSK